MSYLFKKYWYILLIALCINIPLLVLGLTKTDKSVILKGDTTVVENFVEIENPFEQKGSLSTIYVISVDHCTLLQSYMAGASKTSEISEMSTAYLHFSQQELSKAGKIQHESSINHSIIQAYKYAGNCHLDYQFAYLQLDYYQEGSDLRVGDKILSINGSTDEASFMDMLKNRPFEVNGYVYDSYFVLQPFDVLKVDRDGRIITIPLNQKEMIGGYIFYDIDAETAIPKYRIKESNVGGPSGGLLQTLALYNSLVLEDITKGKKIAGTGTMEIDGSVGEIGGIQQKIYTAFDDDIDIFLCPAGNYEEALIAYNKLPNHNMKLYSIESFEQALEVLANE